MVWNSGQGRARLAAGWIAGLLALGAAPAQAQDLVHHFIDPSFGGNPFYSDHLLAIAAIDRPAAPTTPTTTQTQEELIAAQLRAQLLSQLSGTILDRIQNAAVGTSGNFEFGNQQVSYTRTATQTTVTFTNTTTGAVNTVVIPAAGTTGTSSAASASASTAEARVAAAASSPVLAQQALAPGYSALSATPSSAELALLASGTASGGNAVLPPY